MDQSYDLHPESHAITHETKFTVSKDSHMNSPDHAKDLRLNKQWESMDNELTRVAEPKKDMNSQEFPSPRDWRRARLGKAEEKP